MSQQERYEILEQLKQEQLNVEQLQLNWQLFLRKLTDKILTYLIP